MALSFNLIACNSSYPSIYKVKNPMYSPFIGRSIILDDDTTKVYTVGRQVQAAFFDYTAFDLSTNVITVTVSSIKYNGAEQLTSSEITTFAGNSQSKVYYPFSMGVNQCMFDENGLAYILGNPPGSEIFETGTSFWLFLKNLIETDLNLPVELIKTYINWPDNCNYNLEGETQTTCCYKNIVFEKRDSDSIEVTFKYEWTGMVSAPSAPANGSVFKFSFDGLETKIFLNGVLQDSPILMSSDDRAFPTNFTNNVPTGVPSIQCFGSQEPFNTTAAFVGDSANCECTTISFEDESNPVNSTPGHDVFGYRLIRLIRPDGTVYEYSSAASDDPDQVISVLSSDSVNAFNYTILSTDTDGIWEVQVYNIPEWDSDNTYNVLLNVVVHREDALYYAVQSSVGVDPADDDGTYWALYDITSTTLNTRYGSSKKVTVLCISLIGCYKSLIADAFCSIDADPCGTLCKNEKFHAAMKIRVIWDALKYAECNSDFVSVDSQIKMWKNICSCVNS